MSKKLKIIAGILVVMMLIFLFYGLSQKSKTNKVFDKTFTVSSTSYKPYDTKFFYDEIKKNASGFEEKKVSIENSGLLGFEGASIYMVVSPQFYPTSEDIHQLKNYASNGNTAFICSFGLSTELIDSLYYSTKSDEVDIGFPPYMNEMKWHINWKEDDSTSRFSFPGHKPQVAVLDSIYLKSNDAVTQIDTLIVDEKNQIMMLEITCGEGRIFLCNNPILLSNYFLLNKNNYTFFNKIAQKINLSDSFVIWDDYYRTVRFDTNDERKKAGKSAVLKVIFEHPPLLWAFYTFIAGILLFTLIYYRRIQKEVPIYASLKNNSEAYINVVSGLYWEQQNHKSIADKVITQFFDYLLSNFHIHHKDFQENELQKISQKTGRSLKLVQEIFEEISFVKSEEEIKKQVLINLYQKINSFYQG